MSDMICLYCAVKHKKNLRECKETGHWICEHNVHEHRIVHPGCRVECPVCDE